MIEPLEVGRMLARLNAGGLPYVVIGGIAVIAYGYVRTTRDLDVLVPGGRETGALIMELLDGWGAAPAHGHAWPEGFDAARHLRAQTPDGVIDFVPEGEPPLDFASVARDALDVELEGERTRVAGLAHLVALKRLANRPQDRADLHELEQAHGPLPDTDPPLRGPQG